MSSNPIDIDVFNLPSIEVEKETVCNKDKVDAAIKWWQSNKSDLLMDMAEYEHWRDHQAYIDTINRLIFALIKEAKIEIPATRLERLDCIHELGRRIRRAANLPDFVLRGTSQTGLELTEKIPREIPYRRRQYIQDPKLVMTIITHLYSHHAYIVHEYVEAMRREIYTQEILDEWEKAVEGVLSSVFHLSPDSHLTQQIGIVLAAHATDAFDGSTGSE